MGTLSDDRGPGGDTARLPSHARRAARRITLQEPMIRELGQVQILPIAVLKGYGVYP